MSDEPTYPRSMVMGIIEPLKARISELEAEVERLKAQGPMPGLDDGDLFILAGNVRSHWSLMEKVHRLDMATKKLNNELSRRQSIGKGEQKEV